MRRVRGQRAWRRGDFCLVSWHKRHNFVSYPVLVFMQTNERDRKTKRNKIPPDVMRKVLVGEKKIMLCKYRINNHN